MLTPLTRHVPQRRRRNVTVPFARGVAATICVIILVGDVWFAFAGLRSQPSRLQPALEQIQRFGERKCWSGEAEK